MLYCAVCAHRNLLLAHTFMLWLLKLVVMAIVVQVYILAKRQANRRRQVAGGVGINWLGGRPKQGTYCSIVS